MRAGSLCVVAVRWPEIAAGDDLAVRLAETVELADGQILVLTSKVVSKAAGRVVAGERAEWIAAESRRVVARRGSTVIAETNSGLVLAAAGVDASNLPPGRLALLPVDADEAARSLRARLRASTGRNVAVVMSDTAGRPWRTGQTDLAIGCAGIPPLLDLRGSTDAFGSTLDVTMPAIADELAAAGDLVAGKASGCPVSVVTGLDQLVLPPGESGPGAAALVRGPDEDLFGLGTREAVVAAAAGQDETLGHFPRLSDDEDVPFEAAEQAAVRDIALRVSRDFIAQQRTWLVQVDIPEGAGEATWLCAGRLVERTHIIGVGHRLVSEPAPARAPEAGWRTVSSTQWRDTE